MQETLSDVSGAVEVDEAYMRSVEAGESRPSEDILMLLLSHFDTDEGEALGLWELAGYHRSKLDESADFSDEKNPISNKSTLVMMAVDPRIIYSDNVQVNASKSGVVITFGQSSGQSSLLTTARIGMSREQAAIVAHAIADALSASEQPRLADNNKTTD